MKQLQRSSGLFAGTLSVLLAHQPIWAETAKVTAVELSPINRGFNLVLKTTGDRSQVLTSSRGNTLVADIINARLNLPQGKDFRQDKPAPGIASVAITQLNPNSIRMIVTGTTSPPSSQILEQNAQRITFSIISSASERAAVPATPSSQNAPVAIPTPTQTQSRQTPTAQKLDVLVPSPKVTIDEGLSTDRTAQLENPAPTLLPRAIAPPVGDIAVSNTDNLLDTINLDTTERVPRLVLRDAPVREVLALLARAANLNLAFTSSTAPGGEQGQPDPNAANEGPKISLDIQDESVQETFNYVLDISGLQANRRGRTIFVGTRLPNRARGLMMRSFRLNQVTVGVALNFLVAQGAESAISRERSITSVNAVPIGGSATPATQTQTSTETRIETQRIDFQDSTPPLRGLEVVGDERTNSITMNGSSKQIDIATALLVQLDSRRRQLAVNVKIIDINLSATDSFSSSFSFGIGDIFFQSDRGSGILNFGTTNPQSERTRGTTNPPGFSPRFLARLEAQITNGDAKILTDPTLIVQEGQQASVNLTQEVVGNITTIFTDTEGGSRETQSITKEEVGLTVSIRIERIDDNGFVALSVAPVVRAPQDQFETTSGDVIILINERSLNSGLIRLRDSQTLILTGIIQDSDRTSVSKVPLLGDIPIIGALFRSTEKTNQRQEVIVLLTPQIISDSEHSSSLGYNYIPSSEAYQLLERRGLKFPEIKQAE